MRSAHQRERCCGYRFALSHWVLLHFCSSLLDHIGFQVFQTFDRMARQDDEKRRKELEEKMRKKEEAEATAAEQEPVPAPVLEVEVSSTTDAASGGPVGPRGQQGAVAEVAPGSQEDAEPPGSDTGAAQARREPPTLPK